MGVDGKKYKYAVGSGAGDGDDAIGVSNPIMKTETTEKLQDRSMASLKICCPHCEESFDFPELFHKKVQNKEKLASNICPKCETRIPDAYIKNRARLFLKQLQVMYYRGKFSSNFILRFLLFNRKLPMHRVRLQKQNPTTSPQR